MKSTFPVIDKFGSFPANFGGKRTSQVSDFNLSFTSSNLVLGWGFNMKPVSEIISIELLFITPLPSNPVIVFSREEISNTPLLALKLPDRIGFFGVPDKLRAKSNSPLASSKSPI